MSNITGDWIGLLHLTSSLFAMAYGALVLLSPKGGARHKLWGYCYTVAMFTVLVSALFIYRLFGTFGPFHFIAVIGFVYLITGLMPALLRSKNWLKIHVYSMYWSVIGLFAAFFAEVAVRIPNNDFWWIVLLGTILGTVGGEIAYGKFKDHWLSVMSDPPLSD
jgi:uncharacterized membrane protein